MKPVIRNVVAEELQQLRAISITTFTDTFGKDNTEKDLQDHIEKAYSEQQLQQELQDPGSNFFFLFSGDELAGYLKINVGAAQTEKVAENSLEVERIYILPQFKRQGLGRFLLTFALQQAQASRKNIVWLGVWEHNEAALCFYKNNGFEIQGSHTFMVGNDQQTDLVMVKELAQTVSG